MSDIIGVQAAIKKLESRGAHVSRALFYQSIRPKLIESGMMREAAPRVWIFDDAYMTAWAEYLAVVQARRADGRLPGDYEYNEWDCTLVREGAWDD